MDRLPPWLHVVVGLLVALSGVRGVAEGDGVLSGALFVLVVLSGLMNLGWGARRLRGGRRGRHVRGAPAAGATPGRRSSSSA